MSSKFTTTVRLDEDDVRALERARRDGLAASDLIRQGLRLVAGRYYKGRRRPPTTGYFTCEDPKLGAESELFKDLER